MPAEEYALTEKTLTLSKLPPGKFELAITTAIKPQDNSLLEGLYKSSGNFCSQVCRSARMAGGQPVSIWYSHHTALGDCFPHRANVILQSILCSALLAECTRASTDV